MRTIRDISDKLNQLDEAITSEFIPAITGGIHCSKIKRKLLSLPSKLRGLGIPIFTEISNQEYEYSSMLSKDLSTRIMKQEIQLSSETDKYQTKNEKSKTAKTSSKVREHQILSHRRTNQAKQPESRAWIIQHSRYQKKDAISQNSSSGISLEFFMDGHSQEFQHIKSAVKNSTSSMLCLARKVASYHYDTT